MRLCFILEQQYEADEMPRAVAEVVRGEGHVVDYLEPHASITELWVDGALEYDAYVLKTAPDGPGLSILEAAGAAGIPTINSWRSIRLARDKAVAVARARLHGLRVPRTFYASTPNLLQLIAPELYPLVVKPSQGGAGRAVYRVDRPDQLPELNLDERQVFLAQTYVPNDGFDVKVYNTGLEIFAVQWPSPLHPELSVAPQLMPLTEELRDIALAFGRAFGLRIYGVDLLPTRNGWIPIDVNDFPSFHEVPDAAARVAASILHTTRTTRRSRGERFGVARRSPFIASRLEPDIVPAAVASAPNGRSGDTLPTRTEPAARHESLPDN